MIKIGRVIRRRRVRRSNSRPTAKIRELSLTQGLLSGFDIIGKNTTLPSGDSGRACMVGDYSIFLVSDNGRPQIVIPDDIMGGYFYLDYSEDEEAWAVEDFDELTGRISRLGGQLMKALKTFSFRHTPYKRTKNDPETSEEI